MLIEHKEAGAPTANSPQTMRVWPGLKLVGAGGKVAKGTFVQVAEVGPEKVVLDGGQAFSHAELLRQTRLCHAITYASCQGLTLRGRVWLSISTCGTSTWGPAGPPALSCWRSSKQS